MLYFLIGFMGSGKSYWAEKLAQKKNMPCIDLDDYIEEKLQLTIVEIFKKFGEPHFRTLEANALSEIIAQYASAIIACGGGTPCFQNNIETMKDAGMVFYLKVSDVIKNPFLSKKDKNRPLTHTENFESDMQELFLSRKDYYEKAHKIIEVESLNETNFVSLFFQHE